MVYICIDTGSHAKGYAVESSDTDYHIYTKCDRETFEKFIDNKELLKNRHAKDESGNDVKYVDLYTGLIGILTGKSPELSMFSKREDFKDKYGIENLQLYEFVTKLMTVVDGENYLYFDEIQNFEQCQRIVAAHVQLRVR